MCSTFLLTITPAEFFTGGFDNSDDDDISGVITFSDDEYETNDKLDGIFGGDDVVEEFDNRDETSNNTAEARDANPAYYGGDDLQTYDEMFGGDEDLFYTQIHNEIDDYEELFVGGDDY